MAYQTWGSLDRTFRVARCPVCGEKLGSTDLLNDMIHMSLCFDEGTGMQIMTGGFLTDKQAANGYVVCLYAKVSSASRS